MYIVAVHAVIALAAAQHCTLKCSPTANKTSPTKGQLRTATSVTAPRKNSARFTPHCVPQRYANRERILATICMCKLHEHVYYYFSYKVMMDPQSIVGLAWSLKGAHE